MIQIAILTTMAIGSPNCFLGWAIVAFMKHCYRSFFNFNFLFSFFFFFWKDLQQLFTNTTIDPCKTKTYSGFFKTLLQALGNIAVGPVFKNIIIEPLNVAIDLPIACFFVDFIVCSSSLMRSRFCFCWIFFRFNLLIIFGANGISQVFFVRDIFLCNWHISLTKRTLLVFG